MSAGASGEAMDRFVWHREHCSWQESEADADCDCDYGMRLAQFHEDMSALVQRKVEEERERCALVAGHFGNMQQRQDEEGIISAAAAYAVRDAIRIPPPPATRG